MSNTPPKKGKSGNKKHGRNAKKPAHIRYNAERRWEKNKARKSSKHAKMLEKKALRKARKAKLSG